MCVIHLLGDIEWCHWLLDNDWALVLTAVLIENWVFCWTPSRMILQGVWENNIRSYVHTYYKTNIKSPLYLWYHNYVSVVNIIANYSLCGGNVVYFTDETVDMWYIVVDPLNCMLSVALTVLVVNNVVMAGKELSASRISAHKHKKKL